MVDGFWATNSEGVGLIVPAIRFQDFQPIWSWSWLWTDGRHALCTIVHRPVKQTKYRYRIYYWYCQYCKLKIPKLYRLLTHHWTPMLTKPNHMEWQNCNICFPKRKSCATQCKCKIWRANYSHLFETYNYTKSDSE